MILNLFSRSRRTDTIAALYGAIVAQARLPGFYRFYGVPDTVNGRFEMLLLHLLLLLLRLDISGDGVRQLGQAVFDRFCGDMDANLREMGVGDIAVPRKMKAIGEAFYGRKRAYEAALNVPDRLTAALARNVYGDACAPGAERLAAYVREAARRLAALDEAALASGRAKFPDPMDPALAPSQPAGTGVT
jgi:cytochrome b pre-mRNA-processing protein 3